MPQDNLNSVDLNRLPPQARDIEQAVLGAILIEPGTDLAIVDYLKPESFYDPKHQKIFKAIVDLSYDLKPIDTLTVIEQLKKNGDLEEVGGPYYIIDLSKKVASAAHLEFHAKIVAQKYLQRELINLANRLQKLAYDETIEIEELLDKAQKELFDLVSQNIKNDLVRIDRIIKETLNHVEEIGKKDLALTGVPTGYTELDRITSGWQGSDLILIAARPSMGKTAFLLSMARNMAVEYDKTVAIFSLEMSAQQLVQRMIVAEAEIDAQKFKLGKLSDDEWLKLEERLKPLENAKIYIDDTPGISLFELRSKCRKLQTQDGLDIVFVDYLQLMSGPAELNSNREQQVSHISRGLKALAKELNVPVVALSQLNRAVEHRAGQKKPQLSDLRESGSLEQDADIVIFIHRPEKLGITEIDGQSTEGLAEIIIAKFRNGPTTEVKLRFIGEYAKFVDFDLDENAELIIPEEVISIESKLNDDKIDNTPSFEQDNFSPNQNFDFDINNSFENSDDNSTPF